MAQINTGSSYNTSDGDNLRTAFIKTRENFESWDNNLPLSYLFPYTGSARLDGNLDLKGQISFSVGEGEEVILPIATSMNVNYDVTSSTEIVNLNSSSIFDAVFFPTTGEMYSLFPPPGTSIRKTILNFDTSTDTRRLRIGTSDASDVASFGRTATDVRRRTYFPRALTSNTDLIISAKDNPYLFRANGFKIGINGSPSNDGDYTTQVNGGLFISSSNPVTFNWSSQYSFSDLEFEDPHEEGVLFITSSEHLGLTPGSYIICVSQG